MKQLSIQLDSLAQLVAEIGDDWRRPVLEAAVSDLERAAGCSLGATGDPVVLLWRRFGRAHRLLLDMAAPPPGVLAIVQQHAAALSAVLAEPDTAPLRQPVRAERPLTAEQPASASAA